MKLNQITENEYAGLEDADEFDDVGQCDNCQDRGDTYRCDMCRAIYLCGNCVANYDLEDPSGQLIVCPNCKRSDAYIAMLKDTMMESEYAGLEDADEFNDYSCMHCGNVDDSYGGGSWAYCSVCDQNLCSDCGYANPEIAKNWLFVPRSDGYGIELAYCPNHTDQAPENAISPVEHSKPRISESSEYFGLEDADTFDDGSDQEEAEEIRAYFRANNIRVVENNGVIDIFDKHGVLEGLPDGRRFGDDLPVDRVVKPGRDPNFTNDIFVIWVNGEYGLSWLVNYGNDWSIIGRQQWQIFQDTSMPCGGPYIAESSEYEGLEDADEFNDFACMHCGYVDPSYGGGSWAWCNVCDQNLCSNCGYKNPEIAKDWLFVPRIDHGIESAYCPNHTDHAEDSAISPVEYVQSRKHERQLRTIASTSRSGDTSGP